MRLGRAAGRRFLHRKPSTGPRLTLRMSSEPKPEWNGPPIRVGVIGGSGLYKLEGIEVIDVVRPLTVRLYLLT